jgi:hypothetical protein
LSNVDLNNDKLSNVELSNVELRNVNLSNVDPYDVLVNNEDLVILVFLPDFPFSIFYKPYIYIERAKFLSL